MTRNLLATAAAALLAASSAATGAPPAATTQPSASSPPPDAHAHAHDSHAAAADAQPAGTLVPHATDVPLREAMGRVLEASNAAASGKAATSAALADTIDASIAHMVANCKLEPAADAVLHGFIGRLATGAATLRERPGDREALASIRATLRDYAHAFDHPGFAAPEA